MNIDLGENMRFLIYAIIMILLMVSVVHGVASLTGYSGTIGFTVLSDYLDDENGIQLYEFEDETNTSVKEAGHLNLGKFYRDVLKVNADSEILVNCANNAETESFSECIESKHQEDPELQSQYNTQMRHIKSAIDIAQENGMDYMSVPFVRDFVE